MRRDERREHIERLLESADAVEIGELQRVLGVSRETVRQDLDALAAQGRITRARGAAVRRSGGAERAYGDRRSELLEEKRAIAAAALDHLPADGGSVWLDYGTTTLAVAEALPSRAGLLVVTNAFPVAAVLAGRGIDVLVPGGSLRPGELSLSGPMAERNLAGLHLDVGFFGCAGVDPAAGLTNHHQAEAAVSEAAIARCATVVVVADRTKVGVRARFRSAATGDLDVLVTDSPPDRAAAEGYSAAGVRLVVARGPA